MIANTAICENWHLPNGHASHDGVTAITHGGYLGGDFSITIHRKKDNRSLVIRMTEAEFRALRDAMDSEIKRLDFQRQV